MNMAIGQAIHGNFDAAIAECQTAIRLDPDYGPGYMNMAKAYLSEGKPNQAIVIASEGVRRRPFMPPVNSSWLKPWRGGPFLRSGGTFPPGSRTQSGLRLQVTSTVIQKSWAGENASPAHDVY